LKNKKREKYLTSGNSINLSCRKFIFVDIAKEKVLVLEKSSVFKRAKKV